MIYVTQRQNSKKSDEWYDLIEDKRNEMVEEGWAGTITKVYEEVPADLLAKVNVALMIRDLRNFNNKYSKLFERDRKSMYRRWYIPKKTGGKRPIDKPCYELQNALSELKRILNRFGVFYHTSGYAYIEKRNCKQCVRKHQVNENNWFFKTDCSGFFPNTTLEFTMNMAAMIFPLSEICKREDGRKELEKALSLAFLDGGLPQGTVISPTLSNLVSIPIDFKLFNVLTKKGFVYTRYADDMHISCKEKVNPYKIKNLIEDTFKEFGAPWSLKPEKTHFGSRKGRNFMLGLCLNAENNITVGWRAKQTFKAKTTNMVMDAKNGHSWTKEELKKYEGLLSYYMSIEGEYFTKLINHFNNKFGLNIWTYLKSI